MKKNKMKYFLALVIFCISFANIYSENVNATEIQEKEVTCCNFPNVTITNEEVAGPVYGCTEHKRCTKFMVDVYRIKKCMSCKSIYYRNYSYSKLVHTGV